MHEGITNSIDLPSVRGIISPVLRLMPFLPKYTVKPSVDFHVRGISSPIKTLAKVLFPQLQAPDRNTRLSKDL